jgi:uncharacterized protein YhdP
VARGRAHAADATRREPRDAGGRRDAQAPASTTSRGAPTTIKGQLDWPGAPSDYDPKTLSGALKVEVGSGQFTKIEPGIGKLLGVLSLQALPRRIALDFRDVFTEGFAFDRIDGNVRIARGVMTTDDLRLVGPAARVDITGEANLARDLAARPPAFHDALDRGSGCRVAAARANPLVAAAVGARCSRRR